MARGPRIGDRLSFQARDGAREARRGARLRAERTRDRPAPGEDGSADAQWARGLAASELTVTAIQRALGHLDLARAACRDALAIDELLVAAIRPTPNRSAISRSPCSISEISSSRGVTSPRRARPSCVAPSCDAISSPSRTSTRARRELAIILLELSDALAKTDRAASRKAIEDARDLVAPIRNSPPATPSYARRSARSTRRSRNAELEECQQLTEL